jgi:hypothetical protein
MPGQMYVLFIFQLSLNKTGGGAEIMRSHSEEKNEKNLNI